MAGSATESYATILMTAGNDDVTVSRLLRHSAGGKNLSIAAKHYLGRSDRYLRDVWTRRSGRTPRWCRLAWAPWAPLRAVEAAANATG